MSDANLEQAAFVGAAARGDLAMVRWRALTSAAANTFETPNGRTEVLRILLEHGDRPEPGDGDWKALHYAAGWGNADNVTLLIEHGMDPDVRDPDGLTALMRAARGGKVDAARALLLAGANARLKGNDGQTALDLARARKRTKVIALLEG
jgi:ankyrin repeat protein